MQTSTLTFMASIKVPRNQTGAMQLLQLYVQSGHYYWTNGVVLRSKLPRFCEKLSALRIGRDAPGRAYDKSRGLASTHLVLLDSHDDILPWVLVSTAGRGGLADAGIHSVGAVRDARLAQQQLPWKHYELAHLEKLVTRTRDIRTKGGKLLKNRTETIRQKTWTWRLTADKRKGHEAMIAALAKHRDSAGLVTELNALAMMPQFSGVRHQVLKLYGEARKLAGKVGVMLPVTPELPYMVRLPIYSEPASTLVQISRSITEFDTPQTP
jgi:hypothetical protein